MIALFVVYVWVGLVNHLLGLIVADTTFNLPFAPYGHELRHCESRPTIRQTACRIEERAP